MKQLHTEAWQDSGPGWAAGHAPDPLWECERCGAAVSNGELHNRWHSANDSPGEVHP